MQRGYDEVQHESAPNWRLLIAALAILVAAVALTVGGFLVHPALWVLAGGAWGIGGLMLWAWNEDGR